MPACVRGYTGRAKRGSANVATVCRETPTGEGLIRRELKTAGIKKVSSRILVPQTFVPDEVRNPRHDVPIIAGVILRVLDANDKVNFYRGHVGRERAAAESAKLRVDARVFY